MRIVFTLLACFWLASCSSLNNTGRQIEASGSRAAESEPSTSFHYKVMIYPGLDENFDPNPKLTFTEFQQLRQLDEYCAVQTRETLAGLPKEMFRQGTIYSILQAVFGTIGAKLAFGSAIEASEYLTYLFGAGFGGGLANGMNTFQLAENVVQGYCMTMMVQKADDLESKLRRIIIVPMYVGSAEMPEVSDNPLPTFSGGSGTTRTTPPPR